MISPYYWHHHGVKVMMGFLNRIWWKLMPGTLIKVRWPVGRVIVVGDIIYGSKILKESADPNDHYRNWMESNVGRQGWDWDWTLIDNDIYENKLTIKFRKGKENFATVAMLQWS